MSINLKTCDGICSNCIKKYIGKHRLQAGDKFNIECKGIPQEYIPESMLASLGGDRATAISMLDPVTWAAENLDWHCFDYDGSIWKRKTIEGTLGSVVPFDPMEHAERVLQGKSAFHRPYQAEMLRCSSKYKIFRIGRQCLAGETKLQLVDGTIVFLKDVQIGMSLFSLTTDTHKLVTDKVIDKWESGEKPTFSIRTQFGHEIVCTDTHPFWSVQESCDRRNGYPVETLRHGWLTISQGLKAGDKLATPIFDGAFGNEFLPDGLAELLGYFIADGCSSRKQSAKFTNVNELYLQEFEKLTEKFGTKTKRYRKGNGFDLIITNGSRKPNPLREKLRSLGLVDITGPEKRVPPCIFAAPEIQVKLFLQRFWAADGYVSTFKRTGRTAYRTEIGTLQENRKLLEDIQILLRRFGVHGYIKPEKNNWRYVVSNKIGVLNFLKKIGPIFGKELACSKALEATEILSDKYSHTEGDILWDHIVEIKPLGVLPTYDISIETNQNFVAEGLVTHNSGKTECLCVVIAWSMFTHENFAVEVIAPYQSQIDLIFSRLTEMIKSNPILANSVSRNVKAPNYQIKLKNGSFAIGFTAGTRSGQEAGAARGQHANLLVFDEADYLSQKDVDSALAMIINHPNATVWMSSTPTGRRERFFENCQDKAYREFHFPSQVNPNFSIANETYFKSQLSEDAYKHEILAEFGEQEEGVYQLKYVEAAQSDYNYGDHQPTAGWLYMLGVDWNDVKIGTTIAVIGFDPVSNMFYLVDKAIVSKGERTQLSACQMIADLNRKWLPDYIYVDQGYGATQIEVLHEFGQRALVEQGPGSPDSRLRLNVKGYDFGSSVEIHDLFTHQAVKKPSKPFLVENSVRRFETRSFKYPKSDQAFTNQLLGYIVQRVSITGRPVYEAQNEKAGDHFLDAVNLAFVAFALERSKFGKPTYSAMAAVAGRFGEKEDPNRREETKDKYQSMTKVAEQHKPKTGRGMLGKEREPLLKDPNGSIPGANMSSASTKLWAWPGWGHDAPKPMVRSITEAARAAEKRIFRSPHRRNRPNRSKF